MNSKTAATNAAILSDSHLSASALNDVLLDFEKSWSSDDDYLKLQIASRRLDQQLHAVAELIRVDIDLRYSNNQSVNIRRYFDQFPGLLERNDFGRAIAFEDYRSRRSLKLPVQQSRWSWIPGIDQEPWFKELDHAEVAPAILNSMNAVEPQVGHRFGDFDLICLIGSGTFSRVYLALQTSLASRYVAVKVVRQSLSEPVHLARMQHTGIVPLYSFHRIGKYSVLCMPYAGVATLADWMRASPQGERDGQSLLQTMEDTERRLSITPSTRNQSSPNAHGQAETWVSEGNACVNAWAESSGEPSLRLWNSVASQPLQALKALDASRFSLWFAQRIASALAHAHLRGIVHGDLKPANILIRNDGEPALIDFNLSHATSGETNDWVGGTLPYMAPEQFQALLGRKSMTTAASDVYSFGIILYELIEGKLPFVPPNSSADSDLASVLELRRDARLTWRSRKAPNGLKAIVEKCLNYRSSDRYRDAGELLDDIEAERMHLPLITARDQWFASRLPKLTRRYPRVFSAGSVGVASALLVLAIAWYAIVWWRQSNVFAAKEILNQVEEQVELQLPELVDAANGEVGSRLATHRQQLSHLLGDLNAIAASHTHRWLDTVNQSKLDSLIFDHSLVAMLMLSEKQAMEESGLQVRLEELATCCSQFPQLARHNPLFQYVRSRAEKQESQLNSDQSGKVSVIERIAAARACTSRSNGADALSNLSQVTHVPEHLKLLFWLTTGDAQMQIGQPDAALLSYTIALESAPKSSVCYARCGLAKAAVADRRLATAEVVDRMDALSDYSKAIELAPDRADLWLRRGLVHESNQDVVAAISDLSKSLELNPKSNRSLLIRSRLYQKSGDLQRSREDLMLALEEVPTSVEDWVSRGLARVRHSPRDGLDDLRTAEMLQPRSATVLQNIAYVYSEHLHEDSKAIEALDKILSLEPQHEMARGGRCVLYARLGLVRECQEDTEYLTTKFSKLMPSTIYQVGCAYALLHGRHEGSLANAMKYLSRAMQLGYGGDLIATDPDLEKIRNEQEFHVLREFVELTRERRLP
jgi:eukaryotic-like serine/threonine-protein kinase